MTADVRQQLTEALDEAEQRARALLAGVQHVLLELKEPRLIGTWAPGWGYWPDIEAMCSRELRLIERDREMLIRHRPTTYLPDGSPHAEECRGCGENAPCPDVLAAAAFWLGTPEADRRDCGGRCELGPTEMRTCGPPWCASNPFRPVGSSEAADELGCPVGDEGKPTP